MAFILNEYDVEEAVQLAARESGARPNLEVAVTTLARLVDWTNNNSDGWPYWSKPSNAAKKLQEAIHARYFGAWSKRIEEDLTDAELRAALTPVKAFLTRQGIAHTSVLS